jgi:hypothetical protein
LTEVLAEIDTWLAPGAQGYGDMIQGGSADGAARRAAWRGCSAT